MVILAFVLLVLVGVVAFINTELITVYLYFVTLSVPLWATFIAFLLLGMLIATLFATSKGARNRQVIKNKNQEIERAEEEKEQAIKRMQLEKEQAIERMELEKEQAIKQTKKESDLQLELQTREAEIQKLESQLVQDEKLTTAERDHTQKGATDTTVRRQNQDNSGTEEITEYKVDPSNDGKEID